MKTTSLKNKKDTSEKVSQETSTNIVPIENTIVNVDNWDKHDLDFFMRHHDRGHYE